MLDNYDSFTYNIVQYLSELGADLKVYRNDEITADQIIAKKPQAIILSPGPGRCEKAGILNELVSKAAGKIPTLGICLGHQSIAQVFGATITYAPSLMHGKTSMISHDGSKLFKNISNPFQATRYHSLVIDPKTLSDEFTVTAKTDDDIIMGIQHKKYPLYGLQFHPESIMTPEGKNILGNFLAGLKQ